MPAKLLKLITTDNVSRRDALTMQLVIYTVQLHQWRSILFDITIHHVVSRIESSIIAIDHKTIYLFYNENVEE